MSVSLCVLRVEIDEDLSDMADNPADESIKEQKKRDRGARDSKTITVETYASVLTGPNNVAGVLPSKFQRSSPTESGSEEETISFFCGNPLIEVTKGVLHLYKENQLKEKDEAKTLCLLSVPGALGARDLLAFAAACQEDIAHVRVLRDGSVDHYMALLTFRTSGAAREFHAAFDGVPYSSLEPGALCHVARVSRVEWARSGAAPAAHTELPTCPVCLERMDESVAGVLSVQCAHAFHADCLLRWRDASCPVCRCAQTPEPCATPECLECQRQADEGERGERGERGEEAETRDNVSGVAEGLLDVGAGALWICLVCGHVGCGRYEKGHAAKHFMASNHTYALQLGSNRVWDYAGDNFVHRLVQNKGDGKLVAAGGAPGDADADAACAPDAAAAAAAAAKLDAAQLEFTHLLTQQLDSQRLYYEARIAKLEAEHSSACGALAERLAAAESGSAALQHRADALAAGNRQLERRAQQLGARLAALQAELGEERGLATALAAARADWQARAQRQEDAFRNEIAELKEQLRDLMFFVEARGQLERAEGASRDEIAGASVSVAPPAPPAKPRRKRR